MLIGVFMKKKVLMINLIVFLIDQAVKLLVSSLLVVDSSITIIPNFLNITYVINSGAAWSILNNHLFIIIMISLIALLIFIISMNKFKSNMRNTVAFGLIYGGLIGNLFDRIFHGYVIDYLDFKILNYNYPIFNIADIALVCGILLLIIAIFKGEDEND